MNFSIGNGKAKIAENLFILDGGGKVFNFQSVHCLLIRRRI